jgi:glyoxylase-like metal-dependent hydrolase (beta-lactamase superfamily II)
MNGARVRFGRGPGGVTRERIADGVWLVRGGFPRAISNVYLLEDGAGVTLFDAGIKAMAPGLARAAAGLGGITRVVLGHAHEDHRGAAPSLGVPIWCHRDEVASARAPRIDYYTLDAIPSPLVRLGFRIALPLFDGGPCAIDRALVEGDTVAGFTVVSLPGHAPGQIGLWREADRLALTTDCFYTLNPMKVTLPFGGPIPTCACFDHDHDQALASLRKLAELEPAQAWPGHARPVLGDVRATLTEALAG